MEVGNPGGLARAASSQPCAGYMECPF